MIVPESYIDKLDNIGEEGTRMDDDLFLMRDAIVELIEAHNRLELRIDQMVAAGLREPV